jgi:hypothetical protein
VRAVCTCAGGEQRAPTRCTNISACSRWHILGPTSRRLVVELALSTLRAVEHDFGLIFFDVCAVAAPALVIESQPRPAALGTPNNAG